MNIEDLKFLEKQTCVNVTKEEDKIKIKVLDTIDLEDLNTLILELFDYENKLQPEEKNNILLILKDLSVDKLAEVFKVALRTDNLSDPLLTLNIINLIKTYNSLSDEFFADENIYINSMEDFIDLKYEIQEELQAFIKQLSIYFISLFKSYNKLIYTPLDNHISLPIVYKNIFMATDLLTLSGIFAASPNFNTDECIYITDALEVLLLLQEKTNISTCLMNDFLKGLEDGNNK